jgi:maleate cis-trans isomerase
MKGWRARLGFLIPPGNPTVEPELIAMTPPGVSVHFSRPEAITDKKSATGARSSTSMKALHSSPW